MSGVIRVLLPPTAVHLVPLVQGAGCIPVIDATGSHPPEVPPGAWVRTRPGRPAPGTGPVILAELGAPVPDRATWLETGVPRAVPNGFAGLVLKGREAGGFAGEQDGLEALSACPEPGRVILDAGVGPRTAAAAAALGAAGVMLVEQHLGCPELGLPSALDRRLDLPDDEATRVVNGVRCCNSATASVLRRLAAGEDPWTLADGVWENGGLKLWAVGQGIALARGLADRHGTLAGLLAAYNEAWEGWIEASHGNASASERKAVHTGFGLTEPGTAAGSGGVVGSGVLWQEAAWLGRPVQGGPIKAALATGNAVMAPDEQIAQILRDLPQVRSPKPVTPKPAAPAASLARPQSTPAPAATRTTPAVAIIGIGCRFPGANGTDEFWDNIVNGVSAISDIPGDRWDPQLYFNADPSTPDKTYTQIGGFLKDFRFESRRFRIPPKVAKQVDPVQQITLACVADALDDANLKVDKRSQGREFNREKCAVILGNSLGGEVSDAYAIRLNWHEVEQQLMGLPLLANLDEEARAGTLATMKAAYMDGLPKIDEDSMPGELANVIAGRIANAFDLGGANFTVDAACASSMAAIQAGVKSLQDGDHELVITGGADRSMNVTTYVKFCKIGALSPDHSAPFDSSANGFVMGEGCGILVLKRYEDAVRDSDKIYAVIRGIGASSDGKGKGITAPNIQGQIRALERAYEASGFPPEEVDLFEAHGTSTVVGDQVEVSALSKVIGAGKRESRGPIRLGSVKSMIGHLKSAAGAASCIKTALALHHGVYPPSLGFKSPPSDLPLDTIPLQVQTVAEPWPIPESGVRRAGVSAFGFGGTNFHVVLEGYAAQELPASQTKAPPAPQPKPVAKQVAVAAKPVVAPAPAVDVTEFPNLPEGIWATSAMDRTQLLANLKTLRAGRPAPWSASAPIRIAASARDAEELESQLDRAIKSLEKNSNPDMLRARSIHLEEAPFDGKLALLFTGQGSQYLDMGLDLAEAYPVVAETFAEADRILAPTLGKPITEFIRLAAGEDKDAKSLTLRQTEYSQPATLTLDVAILRLLASYGAYPDMVAGHSLGEYGAAVAAGVMTFEQALMAVSARGREMANIRLDDPGKMAGIAASTDAVEAVLAEVDGYVIAANKNCPTQTVIAGASDAVDEAAERFRARGKTVYPLPVSHAFHSNIVAPASDPLRGVLGKLGLKEPRRPITTNVTGEYYPTGPEAVPAIIDLLSQQISGPVEWVAQMERMYADGARAFVECGPKRALTGFAVAILKRRPHRALYTNHPKRGGVASFRDGLAGLLAIGFPVRAESVPAIDLFATPEPRQATTQAVTAYTELQPTSTEALPGLKDGILRIVARTTGYDPADLDLDYELEADLGIDTVKQAEVFSVVRATYGIPVEPGFSFADHRTLRSLIDWAANRIGATRIAVEESVPEPVPVVAPAAIADEKVVAAFLQQAAQSGLEGLDGEAFARALLPAVQGLLAAAFAAASKAEAPSRAPQPVPEPVPQPPPPPKDMRSVVPAMAPTPVLHKHAAPMVVPGALLPAKLGATVVCSGASLGLPGTGDVFDPANLSDMLGGVNRISHIGDRAEKFLEMGLVRLVKDPETGQGSFLPVEKLDQVIRLAGTKGTFDLSEYGVPKNMQRALDITTKLAFAAGVEALRDAGIPLVRTFKISASGKKVPQAWQLPESLRDGTGVIMGSAFPGYDRLVEKLKNGGDDGEGNFDRRFLFQVLSMSHSQFAQFIGARGPNTAVNAACASTTQAVAMADDWIRLGRCERVIVIGADDVTSEDLLPWIGGGFMAAGAASTGAVVEDVALPFDARRHGLVLGMGAVALVMETEDACRARGVVPVAEHLGSIIVNSAFHGTRLNTDHIAENVKRLVDQVSHDIGVTPQTMARNAFFMSHETYTPARGGSAAAEIMALRAAFGPAASEITITNTKGYTGHPMGAGIEDTVAVKALQYGVVPPVANLKVPDEDLGALTLSRGERRPFEYAVRLAAGFGSQLAVSIWRRSASGDDRVRDADVRASWLHEVSGFKHVVEEIDNRTLRIREGEADSILPIRPDISPIDSLGLDAPAPRRQPLDDATDVGAPVRSDVPVAAPSTQPASAATGYDEVLADLVAVVAEKTGYDTDELEIDFELEADLGIDTVKQAEILSELTERYGLERDDDFRISDYPTIEALAGYLSEATGGGEATAAVSSPEVEPEPAVAPTPAKASVEPVAAPVEPVAAASPPTESSEGVLADLIAVVAEKTGYETDELEIDFELEADLGIDTVKQAEILSELTERYGLERDDDFRIADYPTIEALAGYLSGAIGPSGKPATAEPEPTPDPQPEPTSDSQPEPTPDLVVDEEDEADTEPELGLPDVPFAAALTGEVIETETFADLIAVVSEKTGYSPEELEPDFELEADLGVDTVKQAEILSELTDKYSLQQDDEFRLADYPTLTALAAYLHAQRSVAPVPAPEAAKETPAAAKKVEKKAKKAKSKSKKGRGKGKKVLDQDTIETPMNAPSRLQPSAGREWQPEEFDLRPMMTDEELAAANTPKLPSSFRIRRPILVDHATRSEPSLEGRSVLIYGVGAEVDAVRAEVEARGGSFDAPHDIVIDLADDLRKSFHKAQEMENKRPKLWVTVTRLGDFAGIYPLDRGFLDGGRAGLTKSLGREWEETQSKVVDVPSSAAPDVLAKAVCDEIDSDQSGEVFIRDNRRQVIEYVVEAQPRPGLIEGSPVVLITGGGRGICSRIAQELARRGDVRLALVGRSPIPEKKLDVKKEKARIKKALKAAGERVTPAKVDRQLNPLRKGEEVRANVEGLKATGREVIYFQGDLSDIDGVRGLIEEVESALGPVNIVIHGAGVEESRLVKDKDDAAFDRVFVGKANGGRALMEAISADAFFVSMGSVAGRFGNAGQVDYAAANDAMARLCLTRPHSLHVDWTAWDDVGMAVHGGMKHLLEERGVELLPAAAGAGLVTDLIAAGITGEIVVAGSLGDFFPAPSHPLLDRVEYEGDQVRGYHELSLTRDPWVVDHSIEGTPVLPGVIGLELMAAVGMLVHPTLTFVGARNVRFNAPVKVHGDRVSDLIIEAEPANRPGEARARLISVRKLRTGRVRRTEHFSATLLFGDLIEKEALPSAFLPDEVIEKPGIYQRFFHGPIFQVLNGVFGVSIDGLIAEATVDPGKIESDLVSGPLTLEAAFQAAGLHRMIVAHEMGLPMEIEEVHFLQAATPGESFTLMVQLDREVYDIDVDGLRGPLMRIRGFSMVDRGPIDDNDRFPEPEGGRPTCFPVQLGKRRSASEGATASASSSEDPTEWLNADEIVALRSRGTDKRIADRIAGRIAAKRALAELTGVAPLEILIPSADSGEPIAVVPNFPTARVSISHREGHAIAVAVLDGRIGVDLEAVELRPPHFGRQWFSADERVIIGDDPRLQTIAWSIKEAVLKVLGKGMALSVTDIDVLTIGEHGATVALRGEAAVVHGALGGGELTISWTAVDVDEVLISVRMAA